MKPVGVGTGLGLYICRDIIHQLGGAITVRSTVGEGTQFVVRIPAAPTSARRATPERGPEHEPETPLPRVRVLVIDDEPNIGRSVARALAEHDVVVETSGRAGIERLDAGERFDLIFCDVMMPDLGGSDVYDEIVARHPGCVKQVVFMTGGAFTERASDFIERVAARRLDKPFDMATIRAVLREQLEAASEG